MEVQRIRVEGGRVVGVQLESGAELRARAVAASVDPRRLYLGLIDASDPDEDFRLWIQRWPSCHVSNACPSPGRS